VPEKGIWPGEKWCEERSQSIHERGQFGERWLRTSRLSSGKVDSPQLGFALNVRRQPIGPGVEDPGPAASEREAKEAKTGLGIRPITYRDVVQEFPCFH